MSQANMLSPQKMKAKIALAVVGLAASGLWAYVFVYNLSEDTGATGLTITAVSFAAYLIPSIMLLVAKNPQRIKTLAIVLGIVAAIGLGLSLTSGGGGGIVYIVVMLLAAFIVYDTREHQA